jgi:hypothetical protein
LADLVDWHLPWPVPGAQYDAEHVYEHADREQPGENSDDEPDISTAEVGIRITAPMFGPLSRDASTLSVGVVVLVGEAIPVALAVVGVLKFVGWNGTVCANSVTFSEALWAIGFETKAAVAAVRDPANLGVGTARDARRVGDAASADRDQRADGEKCAVGFPAPADFVQIGVLLNREEWRKETVARIRVDCATAADGTNRVGRRRDDARRRDVGRKVAVRGRTDEADNADVRVNLLVAVNPDEAENAGVGDGLQQSRFVTPV